MAAELSPEQQQPQSLFGVWSHNMRNSVLSYANQEHYVWSLWPFTYLYIAISLLLMIICLTMLQFLFHIGFTTACVLIALKHFEIDLLH